MVFYYSSPNDYDKCNFKFKSILNFNDGKTSIQRGKNGSTVY